MGRAVHGTRGRAHTARRAAITRKSTAFPRPIWGALPIRRADTIDDPDAMQPNTAKVRRFLRRLARPVYPRHTRLVVCERCYSEFVNPVSWQVQGETHWWIRLRCGECGLVREVEVTNEEAKRLESDLDRGVHEIAASLARLDREQMIADSDTLTAALDRDLIDPQ
jgi:RNase P subunit RPR2